MQQKARGGGGHLDDVALGAAELLGATAAATAAAAVDWRAAVRCIDIVMVHRDCLPVPDFLSPCGCLSITRSEMTGFLSPPLAGFFCPAEAEAWGMAPATAWAFLPAWLVASSSTSANAANELLDINCGWSNEQNPGASAGAVLSF